MGSRSNWGIVARSEAEFNEIVDNLNEQEVKAWSQQIKVPDVVYRTVFNSVSTVIVAIAL